MVRPADGHAYYSYILYYVDNILCVHHDPMPVLIRLNKYFGLKPTSIGDPYFYLGAKMQKMQLNNNIMAWGMSPSNYVNISGEDCTEYANENCKDKLVLPNTAPNSFPTGYEPEMDVSLALIPEDASYFQILTGIMCWIIELGSIDIATKISLLWFHLIYPRE